MSDHIQDEANKGFIEALKIRIKDLESRLLAQEKVVERYREALEKIKTCASSWMSNDIAKSALQEGEGKKKS